MALNQRTIAATTTLQGKGLFWGKPATVTLCPAEPDTGIVLLRTDLPGAPSSRVSCDTLVGARDARGADAVQSVIERYTAVRVGTGEVRLVEHLMAALGGLQIDNLLVEVDAEEMPCLDGSALPYVEALTKAGIVEQNRAAREVVLSRPIDIKDGRASLKARPFRGGLVISYVLDYPAAHLPRQALEVRLTPDLFVREIAPARTYALREEVLIFQDRDMGGGATPENTIVIEEDGTTATKLRFPNECVRHKILDLVGDLQVIGGRLSAEIVAHGSGHRQNAALAREINRASMRRER